MKRPGSLSLADYPGDYVVVACSKCERRGRLSKAGLIRKYGGDTPLPDLRATLASPCPLVGNWWDACGAHYEGLAKARS